MESDEVLVMRRNLVKIRMEKNDSHLSPQPSHFSNSIPIITVGKVSMSFRRTNHVDRLKCIYAFESRQISKLVKISFEIMESREFMKTAVISKRLEISCCFLLENVPFFHKYIPLIRILTSSRKSVKTKFI